MARKGSTSRALAARAVDAVTAQGQSLDDVFADLGLEALPERDQSLVKALVYGTLRVHLRNQELIDGLLSKPLRTKDKIIEALLSVGLFALTDSQRPDYAVVSATVSAVDELGRKHMRGLVNALLRRFLRERDALLARLSSPTATSCLPGWLLDAIRQDWPADWQSVVAAGNQQAPLWVRVNLNHLPVADWLQQCALAELAAQSFPAVESAALLESPVPVTSLPGFAAGDCSVQDIASQLPARFLAPEPGMRVLDACAAPGGKTGHLLELCPDAELTAVDSSVQRLELVEDNLERLGLQAAVICGDAAAPADWWDGEAFDRILLDAPCSAIGVLRRHPDIRFLRRASDVPALAEQQLAMLKALWPLLKPGGRLLYSTCSILRAENEAVIAEFSKDCTDVSELPLTSPLSNTQVEVRHGLQLLPGQADNDGFYFALLEKVLP